MAAQKVQKYLEKHKVGALFEDLMAKVIHEMPSDPVSYLIKALKKIQADEPGKGIAMGSRTRPPSGSSQSRNLGLTGTPVARSSSLDDGSKKRNFLAKSWAGPSSHNEDPYGSTTKPRDYSRPWLTGSKPIRTKIDEKEKDNMRPNRTPEKTKTRTERQPWNSSTIMPSHDFDELFEKRNKVQGSKASKDYDGVQSWSPTNMDSSINTNPIYRRDRKDAGSQGVQTVFHSSNDLEEELSIGTDVRNASSATSSGVSSCSSLRSKKHLRNPKYAAEEHRRQLQAMLMTNNSTMASRGNRKVLTTEYDDQRDDGTELLENYTDLQSEGVNSGTTSGAKLSKSLRSTAVPTENVRVSICARCARIITGMPSEQKLEVESTFSSMSEVDDDNFESVSQIGIRQGRTAQVWPTGFDTESEPSSRNPVWKVNKRISPERKHMYRSGNTSYEPYDSSRPQSATSERSGSQFFSSPKRTEHFSGYSSDEETDTGNYNRVGSPELVGGKQWRVPSRDSDSDSEPAGWHRSSAGPKSQSRFSHTRNGVDSDE